MVTGRGLEEKGQRDRVIEIGSEAVGKGTD